ncbi:ATP-NAD kinase-like domain-containing protein [Crepidotus variabilis]|uniref:ATP-NAD kinase-like domain-containing protein n=1 Tax=Crepidotus variabilis TaxID=179855 RepID=A0A9P6EQF3_9AGAR|nr:ATP-NAD kinase-like domain-containing protein [Crepidotus variabilis]
MLLIPHSIGVKRSRSFLVFVNPFGGTKQGAAIFTNKVYPLFKASGCELEVIHTTRQGHGLEVAKTLRLDHYDAIVTVSGDGLIHEVLNGLAQHAEAAHALATPVVPIPTGSGNGLSLNLLGIEEGFDVAAAALGAIKGRHMKVDLFSFVQGGQRSISFMSQSLGLMADVDIGTDHLRWMGDTRFMVGLIKGIAQYKRCPVKLSYKLAEQDKHKMAEAVHSRTKELAKLGRTPLASPSNSGSEVSFHDGPTAGLPPLQYLKEDEDGWVTFDEPILYVYAGKGPYVGRDFMAFPVSLPDDGLIDICVMPAGSRLDIIGGLDGAEKGAAFWNQKLLYVKAYAYRIQPTKKQQGYLSVDGEQFPFEDFQVEVHRGLGTTLSMYGHYVAPFEPRARPTNK